MAHAAGIYADTAGDGPEIGTLVAIIDRARNLPNRRSMGKQDPYCAARLGKQARKTNVDKRGGQTPKWDEELRFVVHDSPDYYQLKVSVFNDDKKTELIGESWIALDTILVRGGGQDDSWHSLNCKGRHAGDLRVELTYYDTRPRETRSPARTSPSASPQPAIAGPRQRTRRPLPASPGNAESDDISGSLMGTHSHSLGRSPELSQDDFKTSRPARQLPGIPSPTRVGSPSASVLPQLPRDQSQEDLSPISSARSPRQLPSVPSAIRPLHRSSLSRELESDNDDGVESHGPPTPVHRMSTSQTMPLLGNGQAHHTLASSRSEQFATEACPNPLYHRHSQSPIRQSATTKVSHSHPDPRARCDQERNNYGPHPIDLRQSPSPTRPAINPRQSPTRSLDMRYSPGPQSPIRGTSEDPRSHSSPRRSIMDARSQSARDPRLATPDTIRKSPDARIPPHAHALSREIPDPRPLPTRNSPDLRIQHSSSPQTFSRDIPDPRPLPANMADAMPNHSAEDIRTPSDTRYTSYKPPANRGALVRKSPSPSPSAGSPGGMFSPDSFNAFNPNMQMQQDAHTSSDLSQRVRKEPEGPIVASNGRLVDPSDHLPTETWAPEPEQKTPSRGQTMPRQPLAEARARTSVPEPRLSPTRLQKKSRPDLHAHPRPLQHAYTEPAMSPTRADMRAREQEVHGNRYERPPQPMGDYSDALSEEMSRIDIGRQSRGRRFGF